MVASAPSGGRLAAARNVSAGVAPASAAAFAASSAGVQASTMVFSPVVALPRATMPSSAPAITPTTPSASRSPPSAALAARRNAVPYSGTGRPADRGHQGRCHHLEHALDIGRPSSSLATTALKPRSMFSPWSPSPIARSRSISSTRCSARTAWTPRIHASAQAPTVCRSPAAPQTPRRRAGVCTGASHSAVSSSSSSRTVIEQPCISREVM